MKLAVISHKPCWLDRSSPSGFSTNGGFSFQVGAISELFDSTTVVVPVYGGEDSPSGLNPINGHNLRVVALDQPRHLRLQRKLRFPLWFAKNGHEIWKVVASSDCVHTPVPGDVGTVGLAMARLLRKNIFVRYCGIWGSPNTVANKFLYRYLSRRTDFRCVVYATGGGSEYPEPANPNIRWIFSTSVREAELSRLKRRYYWRSGFPLRLIFVGWLEPWKNPDLVLRAIPLIRQMGRDVFLDFVGDGSLEGPLRELAVRVGEATRVRFLGRLDHDGVFEALQASDILCFPTDAEGFPKAVLEAMACGLPVVTTPVSVLSSLIGCAHGALMKSLTPEELALAVIGLTEDDLRFAEMSRSCQKRASAFTLEKWAEGLCHDLTAIWGPLKLSCQNNQSAESKPRKVSRQIQ